MHPLKLFLGKSGRFTPHRSGTLNPPRCSKSHRTGAQNEVVAQPLRRRAGAKAVCCPRKSGRFTPH